MLCTDAQLYGPCLVHVSVLCTPQCCVQLLCAGTVKKKNCSFFRKRKMTGNSRYTDVYSKSDPAIRVNRFVRKRSTALQIASLSETERQEQEMRTGRFVCVSFLVLLNLAGAAVSVAYCFLEVY
jgi:hypothetical protein